MEQLRFKAFRFPDPLKDAKMEPTQYEPTTTLEKLGDYKGVPFFGSFRGSGNLEGLHAGFRG